VSDDDTLVRAIPNEDGTLAIHNPDGSIRTDESYTDWERLQAMTEDEIETNAVSDVDNPPLTTGELERLTLPNQFRDVRQRLNLNVFQFAERFGIPIATALAWETGKAVPDAGALVLLRVIEHDPEAVIRVVHSRAAD
jgi:putative transcriptional regulator